MKKLLDISWKRIQIRNVHWKLLLSSYVELKKKNVQHYFYTSLEQCEIVLYMYTYIYIYVKK